MNRNILATGASAVIALIGVSGAWANGQQDAAQVLRGETQVQSATGAWASESQLKSDQWFRSAKPETTVKIPGATLRVEKGASVRYTAPDAKSGSLNLSAKGGRVYVSLDPQATCKLNSQFEATKGEFVFDSETSKLYVMEGDAHAVHPGKPNLQPLSSWAKATDAVALDGPDVRKRNRNRKRFTQGEENKGKRIGEDQPPSTPRPTATETPAYTPSPTPSFTPPSPTPPPNNTPPPEVGGAEWPPIVGGLVGAGGIAYLISRNGGGGGNPPPNFFFPPASP